MQEYEPYLSRRTQLFLALLVLAPDTKPHDELYYLSLFRNTLLRSRVQDIRLEIVH
jgi:hypothetical protein